MAALILAPLVLHQRDQNRKQLFGRCSRAGVQDNFSDQDRKLCSFVIGRVMERTNANHWIWDGYLSLVIAGGVDNKLESGKTLFCSYFSLQLTGGFAFWKEASGVIVSSCRIKESQPCVVIRVICWQKVLRENKAHQLHSGSSWTLDKGVKKGV